MLCHSYPDATPEDLQATDNVCIICREEMVTGAKKLPCNHIFHSRFMSTDWHISVPLLFISACTFQMVFSSHCSCLRSWFQRQQTCPTCRMDVLRASQPNQNPAPAPAQAPAPAAPANAPVPPPVNGKTRPVNLLRFGCFEMANWYWDCMPTLLCSCSRYDASVPSGAVSILGSLPWRTSSCCCPWCTGSYWHATDQYRWSTGSGIRWASVLPPGENVEYP